MSDRVFREMHEQIIETMHSQPDTPETRAALISIFIMMAAGIAKGEPQELREHWAKVMYRQADALASRHAPHNPK